MTFALRCGKCGATMYLGWQGGILLKLEVAMRCEKCRRICKFKRLTAAGEEVKHELEG